jgi:hypothetical protein
VSVRRIAVIVVDLVVRFVIWIVVFTATWIAVDLVVAALGRAIGPTQATVTYWIFLLTLLLCLWDSRWRPRRNR